MEQVTTLSIISGVLAILLILSGIRLRLSGEPYKFIMLNAHKLLSAGIIALLVIVTIQHQKEIDVGFKGISLFILSALFLITAIGTGGILTVESKSKNTIKILHRISSVLTVIMIPVIWLLCH